VATVLQNRVGLKDSSRSLGGASAAGLLVLLAILATAFAVAFAPRTTVVLLVGGLASILAAWLIVRFPELALRTSLFIVLVAWTKFRTRDPLATLTGDVDWQIGLELGLYALLAAIAFRLWFDRGIRMQRSRWIDFVASGYVVLAIASVAWSPVPRLTAVRALQLAVQLGLVVAIVRITGRDGLIRNLTNSLLAYVAIFGGAALLVPGARGSNVIEGGFSRIYWFSMPPGAVASVAAIAGLLLLTRLLFRPRDHRERWLGSPSGPWMAACVLLLTVLMLAARTRGVVIAFFAAVSVIVLLRFARSWTVAMAASAALLIVAVALSLSLRPDELLRAGEISGNPVLEYFYRGQSAAELATLSSRTGLWEVTTSLARSRPVVGHGYLASRIVLLREVPWAAYAHNAWFQSLLDLGVVGTALLALLLVSAGGPLRERPFSQEGPAGAAGVALATFLLLGGIVGESFAGGPGLDSIVFFSAALAAARSPEDGPWQS
jgi:exopolysaccharide production protein ExoQ